MTLTVPYAGSAAGRAPQLRTEASTTGQALGEFGQRMQETFQRVEAFQLDTELQRAQVDVTRELNDLRLEVEQIGDPQQAETRWVQGSQAIREGYLSGQTAEGRGRIAPKNADRFSLSFDRLANAHAYSLGERLIRDRFAQREASFMSYAYEAARQGSTADPETRSVLIAQGDEQIDAMVAGGVIDAAKGQALKIGLRGDIDGARAIDMVNSDPEGFLEASNNPANFPGLSGEQIAQRRVQARNELDRRAAAEKTAAEAEARRQKVIVGNEISDAVAVLRSGKPLSNPDFLQRDDVRAHEDYPELATWARLSAKVPDLAVKTPDELREMTRAERKRPGMSAHETEELSALERLYDEAVAGWAQDPIAFAREKELLPAPLEQMPDPADRQAYASALRERMAFAGWLNEKGYTEDALPLDKAEQDALKRAADVEQDPAARADLALALAQSAQGRPGTALDELLGDRVLAYTGGFLAGGGGRGTAEEILKGQRLVELGTVKLPPVAERQEPTFDMLDQLFVDLPGGDLAEAHAREAADALYAARLRRSDDPGEGMDEDRYQQALHEVLGGTGEFGRRGSRGGVQSFRGVNTVMPMGVRAEDVERALDSLGQKPVAPRPGPLPGPRSTYDESVLADQLAAISGGRSAEIEGRPVTADQLADFHVKAIGDDAYVFVRKSGEGTVALYDETGNPFTFSMRRLLREGRT